MTAQHRNVVRNNGEHGPPIVPSSLLVSVLLPALSLVGTLTADAANRTETIALWPFDEPAGMYPSSVMDTCAGINAPLVLGLGGRIVDGKFGSALSTEPYPLPEMPTRGQRTSFLDPLEPAAGRKVPPLSWATGQFTALMTSGETHLRKFIKFANPTLTDLNLGQFDWTIEFWLRPVPQRGDRGVVLEIGSGPRGENEIVTRLTFDPANGYFVLENAPAGTALRVPTDSTRFTDNEWHHCALVYHASDGKLVHFLDGHRRGEAIGEVRALPEGTEAYVSVGRDGQWQNPLPADLDELRISRGLVYRRKFQPPASFAPELPVANVTKGLPLLFAHESPRAKVVPLGSRKYVFIDDALFENVEDVRFVPRPPGRIQKVIGNIEGQFRKHLSVIEDDDGVIRLYAGVTDDYLAVRTSRDGVNFEIPDTGLHHEGHPNIVIAEETAVGRPVTDPNGPPEARWKFMSTYQGRGVYVYVSPDGWRWKRMPTAAISMRSDSQTSFFYDDQRGVYVAYLRTGFGMTPGGQTRREFVMAETTDPYRPWPFTPLSQREVWKLAESKLLRHPQPWWLDNGPLTPGDIGIEYPVTFTTDPIIDRSEDGIYVPKATKYPWAPDTYVAFPAMYHQFSEADPAERARLEIGSGDFRTHVAVSRDGIRWRRYAEPAYVPELTYGGRTLHQIYVSEGLVRRGDEIWQYFFGMEDYHSQKPRNPEGNAIYRMVQRLDGFVAAEAAGDRPARLVSHPLIFSGPRLELNVDTGSTGTVSVGFEDADGRSIPGFSVEECVPVHANSTARRISWRNSGEDLSSLEGRTVRLVIRMRDASLYALQFVQP